ncbi:MAG TPA: ribosome maturation factor RimP [Gemmatimonadaceae bacterium]|nr:ribosome maturation factor RimP [Gemmatimonadaceae bacterium]
MNQMLEQIVTESLDSLSLDLVELRVGGSRARPTVDVRIDRRDGTNVSVDDCASASRAIEEQLDRTRQLGDRYVLEVSSPGLERPLKKVADWRRFVGRRASVLSAELSGRVEVEILGVEGDEGAEVVRLRTPGGDERRVALAAVKDARLAFNW